MATSNDLNISEAGFVKFDGVSVFTGEDAVQTIVGDSGSVTGETVQIYANNAAKNSGSTVSFVNSVTTSTLNVSDSLFNTAIGKGSGPATFGGGGNTILGVQSGPILTTGQYNSLIGTFIAPSLSTGSANTCVGYSSGTALSSGASNNTLIGNGAGSTISSTSDNICIGNFAGTGITNQHSNIVIGRSSVGTGSNRIIIGTQGSGSGQQDTCVIAGITGVSVSNLNTVTINTSTGQLGSQAFGLSPYTATSTTPYVVLSTDYFISVDASGGAKQVNLPNAPTTGQVFKIKDRLGNAAANNITVTTVGGAVNIDSTTSYVISSNYGSISVIFNGSFYEIF